MATKKQIEVAARAMCAVFHGDPDWPVGIDRLGYHQEPFVNFVPSWQWFYARKAQVALEAVESIKD